MFAFIWGLIIPTTIVLYALTIVCLPFSTLWATIWLFSLIAFWSRLPGVCIMEPVRFLYMMDFIDVFSAIIAIYVGPFQGAMFALFWNIYPRLCGAYTLWLGNIKDGISQAIVCLMIPAINAMVNGDLVLVMTIFSLIRLPIFFLISLALPSRSIPDQIFHLAVGGLAVLIINAFYAKLFGNFFINLMKDGVSFSWTLFFIATVIILIFAITVYGFSPKKAGKDISRKIVQIARRNIVKPQKTKISDDMDEMKRIKDML